LKSINFPVEIITKDINSTFTGVPFDNSAATNNGASQGFMVNPDQIIPFVDRNVDVTCLMYDWNEVTPKPTNPIQNPRKLGNSTITQIPENWYATYPEVMAQYFVHENLCHALYFLLEKSNEDRTHYQNQDPTFSQKSIMEWQLHLIKTLMPFWNKPFKVLSLGMSGASQLQKDLKTLGYFTYPLITGYFGAVTKKAVIAFQKANGIIQTGNYGPITDKALQEALKKKSILDNKSTLDLLSKIDFGLLPEVQAKADLLIEMAGTVGMDIRITEGYRSPERQNELYAQGRTTPGKIVTWAKAGQSYHQSRKAFDVCFVGSEPYPNDDTKWKRLADIGKSIGLNPGYYFPQGKKDSPHFEVN
jgi:peptidoglycan hydrolase-like protein with peptidoglycan-binding domain